MLPHDFLLCPLGFSPNHPQSSNSTYILRLKSKKYVYIEVPNQKRVIEDKPLFSTSIDSVSGDHGHLVSRWEHLGASTYADSLLPQEGQAKKKKKKGKSKEEALPLGS